MRMAAFALSEPEMSTVKVMVLKIEMYLITSGLCMRDGDFQENNAKE